MNEIISLSTNLNELILLYPKKYKQLVITTDTFNLGNSTIKILKNEEEVSSPYFKQEKISIQEPSHLAQKLTEQKELIYTSKYEKYDKYDKYNDNNNTNNNNNNNNSSKYNHSGNDYVYKSNYKYSSSNKYGNYKDMINNKDSNNMNSSSIDDKENKKEKPENSTKDLNFTYNSGEKNNSNDYKYEYEYKYNSNSNNSNKYYENSVERKNKYYDIPSDKPITSKSYITPEENQNLPDEKFDSYKFSKNENNYLESVIGGGNERANYVPAEKTKNNT